MTKAEIIERYGQEQYDAYRSKARTRFIEHYNNEPEFREAYKAKCRKRSKERNKDAEYETNNRLAHSRKYCQQGEFERIENYELAKADNFKGWCIHHRLELTLDGEYAHSKEDLIRLDMYYNRPYFELIYLKKSEHMKLHNGNKIKNK